MQLIQSMQTGGAQLAEQEGLSVIREYGGHGIGKSLHMPPVSKHP